jgi:hypothetical protein
MLCDFTKAVEIVSFLNLNSSMKRGGHRPPPKSPGREPSFELAKQDLKPPPNRYKSCSPFSYLLECVEITLFHVVFIQKNKTKKQKNVVLLKIFYLISPQWEHFKTKFQLILEATVQGYNFRFCLFLVIGHVTIVLISHWMDPV